jgi:hypothetical protein
MNPNLAQLEKDIEQVRKRLVEHPLYSELNDLKTIRLFMEQHVFAVWDFMSLLKALQRGLTCTDVPWFQSGSPKTRRFINEIVLGEESDIDKNGIAASHFELYLEAMNEIGADTTLINSFIQKRDLSELHYLAICSETKEFVQFTFDVIMTGKLHLIASVFTFGREDIIPEMFIEIVKELEKENNSSFGKLIYYLERHIEIDGDEHGPMSLNMIAELCGDDLKKWSEVTEYAIKAMEKRILLWDGIQKEKSIHFQQNFAEDSKE